MMERTLGTKDILGLAAAVGCELFMGEKLRPCRNDIPRKYFTLQTGAKRAPCPGIPAGESMPCRTWECVRKTFAWCGIAPTRDVRYGPRSNAGRDGMCWPRWRLAGAACYTAPTTAPPTAPSTAPCDGAVGIRAQAVVF